MSPDSSFTSVTVIGRGRLGAAVAARLEQGGVAVEPDGELRLLCVPDRAISEVAAQIDPGPWVAHMSGATPLSALAPHELRFSVHPLQSVVTGRGPEQLDGAWGAVCAESDQALSFGHWMADALGLRGFDLADENRALYHAGAAMASNYLVTLQRAAAELFAAAGAPPEALEPLLRRTIENGFELTGPIARGDSETIERHLAAIRQWAPKLEPAYLALASLTQHQRL